MSLGSLFAQELKLKDFRHDPSDAAASVNMVNDLNGSPCSLIKIDLVASRVEFEGDVVKSIRKGNEYWVYMLEGSTWLNVKSAEYIAFRYEFPPLKKLGTYVMQLVGSSAPSSSGPVVSQQYVVFSVTPKDAMLTFDGQILPLDSEGIASRLVRFGSYTYSVQSKDYHSYNGSVTVDDPSRKVELNVQLKPAFGFLTVTGNGVQQASIYVDGKQIGTGHITEHRLSSGTHTLSVAKALYKPYSQQFRIADGQTTTLQPNPEASFATVTINAGSGVEIWVNDEKKGTGSWNGRLAYGTYRIEARKAGHRSSSVSKDIVEGGGAQTINLPEPTAICGGLNISSDPSNSDISLDGQPVGRTPLLLSSTPIGRHTISVSRQGYETSVRTIDLKEGEMLDVKLSMKKSTGNTVSAVASDASSAVTPSASSAGSSTASGTINGHEYVDLGLSVKWATCNVGASTPEGYGDYFAWGETSRKNKYSWNTLKYCNNSRGSSFSKYNQDQRGTRDNKTRLELSDDAARVNWGGSWRTPTYDELDELKNQCIWQWTTVNGHNGYRVTSKRNGRSIFLPAAGYRYGGSFINVGLGGDYWSSSLTSSSLNAYNLGFFSDGVDWGIYSRSYGQSVRAVSE